MGVWYIIENNRVDNVIVADSEEIAMQVGNTDRVLEETEDFVLGMDWRYVEDLDKWYKPTHLAIDTFGFCHNVRVFKDYTDLDDLPMASITLGPNPASDFLNVHFNQAIVNDELLDHITVYNVLGNAIDLKPMYMASNKIGFNLSTLPGGNYWLTIDVGKGVLREEFIVVH